MLYDSSKNLAKNTFDTMALVATESGDVIDSYVTDTFNRIKKDIKNAKENTLIAIEEKKRIYLKYIE